MNKSFWMPRDAGYLNNGDMNYDTSSSIQPKRAHQWFMDTSEPIPFDNKKQAIGAVDTIPIPGISTSNISLWGNTSNFQTLPGQFTSHLYEPETARNFDLVSTSIETVATGNPNIGRKDFEDQIDSNSLVGLSMLHSVGDPLSCLNYSGIRKVKVNEVSDPKNGMSVTVRHSYSRGDIDSISVGTTLEKSDNEKSLCPSYSSQEENTILMNPAFGKMDDNFISMGLIFNKGGGNLMSMGNTSNKEDNFLSMGQSFLSGNGGFISMDHQYEKGNDHIMPTGRAYAKGQENFISAVYNKASENFIPVGPCDGGDDNMISSRPISEKADRMIVPVNATYEEGNSSILSLGQNCNKDEHNTISFPSGRIIGGYDLLISQPSAQTSESRGQEDEVEHNGVPIANVAATATSKNDAILKSKEQKPPKKIPPNNFPSNVKSLLSTGMLDGVPVKYVSWSRKRNLKGIIKGTGYLCGCEDCKFSQAVNAYGFERHAGCKTKHPNNHIYFENGKTIYAVVQELKSTPQEMLFEAIQNVTGSTINQKNFRSWKESYEAATRELQRIYGKEEVIMPS
ncbi:uncharacterized protein LOC127798448 isoform X2 [Diospyros lotus]|uniref:uncharacterized protein LOC127798448 isoform X2 n=1 Tax=Diospyros lotus TaxID=55363 RepID=UPI00225BF9B8|nr:uncharacterized protein LOC127798448 isoform X2 [Diospyros lotus]